MSFNASLSPNTVKTALDDVYFQEYNQEQHPQYATAETAGIFQQEDTDNAAYITEVFKGVGRWNTRDEEQEVPQGNPRIANTKTFSVLNYSRAVDIPKTFFDDNIKNVCVV